MVQISSITHQITALFFLIIEPTQKISDGEVLLEIIKSTFSTSGSSL